MKKLEKMKKTVRGITLIALVVTIIVLLILAGIAINLILGDNGLLNRAEQGKNAYEIEEAKEEATLLVGGYGVEYIEKEYVNQDSNVAEIDDYIEEKIGASGKETAGGRTVMVERKKVIVKSGSKELAKGVLADGKIIWNGGIMASLIDENNYGDYVNYPVDLGLTTEKNTLKDGTIPKTNWRIFYADDVYIYLIAADYLPSSQFPEGVSAETRVGVYLRLGSKSVKHGTHTVLVV